MVVKQQDETKLLMLPNRIVDGLKEISFMKGISPTSYATMILEKAFEAEKTGYSIDDAIQNYKTNKIQKGAGTITIPKNNLTYIIVNMNEAQRAEFKKLWMEEGQWYGKYLSSIFQPKEAFNYLKKDLQISWNLDEVDINFGDVIEFKFTSFLMSQELTEMFLIYVKGILESFGYSGVEQEYLRGLAKVVFRKTPKT